MAGISIDWVTVIKDLQLAVTEVEKLGPPALKVLIDILAAFGVTVPVPAEMKGAVTIKEGDCNEATAYLLPKLACQRQWLVQALKDNCLMECKLTGHPCDTK